MALTGGVVRRLFHGAVDSLLESSYVRRRLWRAWGPIVASRDPAFRADVGLLSVPERYQNALGGCGRRCQTTGPAPIFVTARFRSGSTFLWQIFRNIPQCTAYYEPLNERRWFLQRAGDQGVDPTHVGVDDYAKEYAGLSGLDGVFSKDWAFDALYMDTWNADSRLLSYIRTLIDNAQGRAVLQFNRIDFRLPWLRAQFPQAKILHLYRDPREQWMSVQSRTAPVPLDYRCTEGSDLNLFYTLEWARDLRTVFPFLDPVDAGHPYAVHYMLWRLSYSFGACFGDISVAYEDLCTRFFDTMSEIGNNLEIEMPDLQTLSTLNHGTITEKWRGYAPMEWYLEIERECDRKLAVFFDHTGTREARA